ncbi:uncharacterized protein C22orf31-like isoform X1 [Siniperca chuatsi]|uniref:uncharacterized protein C22orf31-like isoform X1 n=1 Tax=Siniperca chuatsi TaxID=119488 RepID=UPI001CE136FE|nr:uncharacterized protein C22orf31-like isoform X1 [Siniperca chuatsi]
MEKEVMSGGSSSGKAVQQNRQKRSSDEQQPLLIHGLSVERYREIYHSVLQPSLLAALPASQPADYVSQVLELKQRLWTALSRPRLEETLGEDGRVEVKEIFDLT